MIGRLKFVTADTGFAARGGVVDASRRHGQKQQGDRHRKHQPDDSIFSSGCHDD